ncbi:hypothetical protein H3V53_34110 [Paraburkholderia bengalensis]|uniref:Uncharacterized protein n=1 Tax=Paraburkholderia bengalensis TaxID=2747562 RepID=A0ABU8J2U8_9BURK
MNANLNSEPIAHTAVRIGVLDRAGNRAQSFKEAAELRVSAPVFVAPVDEALMDHVSGRAILRQGVIPLPTGGVMFVIRIQLNDTQFVWLADPTDQEVWRALDAFRKTKQAGFELRSPEQVCFVPYETQDTTAILERFRSEIGRKDRMFIEAATALISYGDPAVTFESMRPNVKVNHHRVCILMTERVKATLAERGGITIFGPTAEAVVSNGLVPGTATVQ